MPTAFYPFLATLSLLPTKRLQFRLRQLVTLVTLVGLGVCTLGIPLPNTVEKDPSEHFPCMNCPCGCKTAEKCWRDCCCHTLADKLAWAQEHGVTPPTYVLAAAKIVMVKKVRNGCHTKTASLCCSSHAKAECSNSDHNGQQQRAPVRNSKTSMVLAVQSQRCQGLTLSLTTLPPTVMPSHVVVTFFTPPVEMADLLNEQITPSPFETPDTPPPQSV